MFGEDLYDHISGEIRYLYHDGHAFLSAGGVKSDMQGQSHTFTYDLLFHLNDREHRLRPFFAAGGGAKGYVVAGPAPFPQPIPNIASLVTSTEIPDDGGYSVQDLDFHVAMQLPERSVILGQGAHDHEPGATIFVADLNCRGIWRSARRPTCPLNRAIENSLLRFSAGE